MSWKKIVKTEDDDTLSRESLDSLEDLKYQLYSTMYGLENDKPELNLDLDFFYEFKKRLLNFMSPRNLHMGGPDLPNRSFAELGMRLDKTNRRR